MQGVCGWFGTGLVSTEDAAAVLKRMLAVAGGAGAESAWTWISPAGGMALDSRAGISAEPAGGGFCATGSFRETEGVVPADLGQFIARLRKEPAGALRDLRGQYAMAFCDRETGDGVLAVDRMGTRSAYFAEVPGGVVFGPGPEAVAAHPAVSRDLDPQSLFDYLYFHVIPGPASIYRKVRRLLPGQLLEFRSGRAAIDQYWAPVFREERSLDRTQAGVEFRHRVESAVRAALDDRSVGAFLSGGTDSSTVSGMLGRVTGRPPRTFSIGFDAEGYDETPYARAVAAHFGSDHHEYFVTPADVVDAIPRIAAYYDQPFGNASVVPSYYCARLAREHGVELLLGGDGGDELFGGNSRYGKQWIFSLYDRVPGPLKRFVLERIVSVLPSAGPLSKIGNYVRQARVRMPDRMETYNLLSRIGVAEVLHPDLLGEVQPGNPLDLIRAAYDGADAEGIVNRMLARDMRFTLADDDLVKVRGGCDLAGVDAVFPFLDEGVVDFSLKLPSRWKVDRTRLRPFFKEALSDFLPPAVISKSKHGFGLPFGVWLADDKGLRELAGDSLSSLAGRGIVRADFLDRVMTRYLAEHPGYYGTMVWILMMLEQWFQTRAAPVSMPAMGARTAEGAEAVRPLHASPQRI